MAKASTPAKKSAREFVAGEGGMEFVSAKVLTKPLLKVPEDGTPVIVKIDSQVYQGKALKAASRSGKEQMEPAFLFDIVDMEDGEEKVMIANAVLRSTLEDNYEDASYVGKYFRIRQTGKKSSGTKNYKTYDIQEVVPKS